MAVLNQIEHRSMSTWEVDRIVIGGVLLIDGGKCWLREKTNGRGPFSTLNSSAWMRIGIDVALGRGDHRGSVNGLEVLPHRLWVRQWRIRPVLCFRISSAECSMAQQTHWDRRLECDSNKRWEFVPVVRTVQWSCWCSITEVCRVMAWA